MAGGPEGQRKVVGMHRVGNQTDWATSPSSSISLLSVSVPQLALLYNVDDNNASLVV